MDELITQVLTLLQTEIQSRHATVRVTVGDGTPRVEVDRILLQQVILNLSLNGLDAMQAMPNEQRTLSIRASRNDAGLVEVEVSDRGTGIAPERWPHLFEAFSTTKEKGTGIGLAISKTIVESHGGRIGAENNPAGGSTFRFTLRPADAGRT